MSATPRIGVVTCRVLPEPDLDQELLLDALAAAGAEPVLLPWDEPGHDLTRFDLCILRSCWNYMDDVEGFRAWLERADREMREWFVTGAAVLAVGVVLGLIIAAFSKRRRPSAW